MGLGNLIYLQYIYFGPLFVMVLALSKLISREKLKINYFYSLSYLFMGLSMFQVASYSTKAYPYYRDVSYYMIPFAVGFPPMLYLRFRFLILGKIMHLPRTFIIFILKLAVIIITVPAVFYHDRHLTDYIELRPLLDTSFSGLPLYFKIVHYINFSAKIILGAGLLSLLLRTMFLWKKRDTDRIIMARVSYIFTILMFITSVLLITGDLVSFEFSKAAIAMVNTVTLGVFFASQYDASYYGIFKHVKSRKKYAVSKVRGIDVKNIITRLNEMMIEKELYKEEDITLKTVAEMMEVNLQQLSEIINRDLKKSFSTYINDFKITEAKKLLATDPQIPITRIALTAGFNSVRTFNRVFGKYTGSTPGEYRKSIIKK